MNFIDGIDGLAASLSVFLSLIFGYIFYQYGQLNYSYTSLALGGAVLGFLIFNFAPARIFMGDIGSMLIGVFMAIFGIQLANMDTLPLGLLQIRYPGTIMFARGVKSTYEYDPFNRLKCIKDHFGNTIKQFEYHYYSEE
jgi:UDP-N-acetylmuramyl pentapeptide phosphotransferase/UDP-N-acetylglucosamine-1-phosphate transferase